MSNIDVASFFDDFESEAKVHIETIESAFLDIDTLSGSSALMDGVFRAAHSLKGTAGFFSFDKIVSVAHELESVFFRIKNGELRLTEEIADVVLESVDALKRLANSLHSLDSVDIGSILELLLKYSNSNKTVNIAWGTKINFDLKASETQKLLKAALRRGHKLYYIGVDMKSGLGRYAKRPAGLFEAILSIGSIIKISLDGIEIDTPPPSSLSADVLDEMARRSASSLSLLVSSVLEPELFLIAAELDSRLIRPIPKEAVLGSKSGEISKSARPESEPYPYAPKADFSIRLDISFINGFMDLANEMILTRNQLLSLTSGHVKSITGLAPVLNSINRLTSEIQDKVIRARMQPIGVIFSRFPRIVRDAAKSLQKDIRLEIFGGNVALDKYMLDSLSDPITQLVKNSADHGIERAERRESLGKPSKGTITLDAYMRDGMAIIEVSDDGAGLDTEYIKKTAIKRGSFTQEQLACMSESEIFGLIFEPGFSTAKQVTSVSGRGVGMDIVKTNIEQLGGTIEIESRMGQGTTTRLKMPLTLSVIRTLIIKIQGVQYAIPEINVERIVRVSGASGRQFERVNDSLVLNLDGWILPLVSLGNDSASPDEALLALKRGDILKCLVLKAGTRFFALLIDDALETEETLIKPLPVYLNSCRCYCGVTVLGSGSAIMVLDAMGLMRSAGLTGVEMPPEAIEQSEEEQEQIIVFKCSGAEYYAVNAEDIGRIERLSPDQIQEICEGEYANIAGRTVQIIRPENYAPVQKRPYAKGWLYLLMLESADCSAGLLAARVLDKANAFALDNGPIEGDYILGTSIYGEKILIHLDTNGILNCASGRGRKNIAEADIEGRCASSEA